MAISKVARAVVAALMVGGLIAAAPTAGPTLTAVARIEPGQWQIKELGTDSAARTLCIADPTVLIQYGHSAGQCQRFIIDNEPDLATVHYTCPGNGHGRTTFKISTPRAFNLDTQGIVSGAPFDYHYEARRIGACPPGASTAR
ncbi:MAG: DUF3617 domain-containing protein [Sphingomonas sp.]|jgi:hypothetical protein|uniref:DUF3617 domain-containing protein n=1 Tax=unclassified Sphingomonas TaxID=196159 RepID=UPI00053EC229|nr:MULTISPECIES: hypothetical protein [unclassified Sphingomonas]MDR6847455.1 sarcosine oxidase gamma subunit [Sphingomonas sp. BE137]MDR7256997.1 sarcosine oxidase gamma subunit [Sphingomonas sp. BE270]RUN76846.1 hypothetical protein EJC47_09130 [Sphingomonas sp. TF3]